jgi:hypothetical protein
MEVTTEMVQAAIKQAVKDKIIPSHAVAEDYVRYWESMRRIIEAAIKKSE